MAIPEEHQRLPLQPKICRFPQPNHSDFVRWVPSPSPFQKSFLISSFNPTTHSPSLLSYTFDPSSSSPPDPAAATWTPPSRVTSLASAPSLFAAATASGSVHVFPSSSVGVGMEPVVEVGAHAGRVGGVDLGDGVVVGECCVSVGEEDGKVNVVGLGEGEGKLRNVFDGNGLVSYTAVKWASGKEFVTGGFGVGLQWWDLRRPVPAVAQLKDIWDKGATSGIIHSIDIHPSRKHTCLAGGSLGTVLAWDLRWQQQPVILSGGGLGDSVTASSTQSEVWEVQFDCYTKSSSNISSSRILPAMICSEDGILAVVEQGEEPTDLLAEPCAINSFDIDRHNPSDIICCLEWESIAIISRP